MNSKLSLTEAGGFIVGCNYWASHAGTAMWADSRLEVVKHSRYVNFQLAEVAVPRGLFAAILGRIQRVAPAPT